jgi:peptidoglycan hydrolase-like protein with peptidoglycan-binding domain
VFTKDLSIGSKGTDVYNLQKFLNNHGFIIAKTGAGSKGNETTKFGSNTKAALMKFQKAHGIVPATGNFGPATRLYISKMK